MQLTQDDIDSGAVLTVLGVQTETPMGEVTNFTSSHEETSMTRLPGITLGKERRLPLLNAMANVVVDQRLLEFVSIVVGKDPKGVE